MKKHLSIVTAHGFVLHVPYVRVAVVENQLLQMNAGPSEAPGFEPALQGSVMALRPDDFPITIWLEQE